MCLNIIAYKGFKRNNDQFVLGLLQHLEFFKLRSKCFIKCEPKKQKMYFFFKLFYNFEGN